MRKLIPVVFLLLFTLPVGLLASTNIYGTIGNSHWTLEGSPYVLVAGTTVQAGDTLTIDPGVVVQGAYGVLLRVDGVVLATGTADNSILFTSQIIPMLWDGVLIAGEGARGEFTYCTFEYAGTFNFLHGGAMYLGTI